MDGDDFGPLRVAEQDWRSGIAFDGVTIVKHEPSPQMRTNKTATVVNGKDVGLILAVPGLDYFRPEGSGLCSIHQPQNPDLVSDRFGQS